MANDALAPEVAQEPVTPAVENVEAAQEPEAEEQTPPTEVAATSAQSLPSQTQDASGEPETPATSDFDAIAALEAKIAGLEADNATLHGQLYEANVRYENLEDAYSDLEAGTAPQFSNNDRAGLAVVTRVIEEQRLTSLSTLEGDIAMRFVEHVSAMVNPSASDSLAIPDTAG